ncbi:MAG: hypothetical protein WCP52_03210 [Bacteroidota bacterium]
MRNFNTFNTFIFYCFLVIIGTHHCVAQSSDTLKSKPNQTPTYTDKTATELQNELDVGDIFRPLLFDAKQYIKRKRLRAPQITDDSIVLINPLTHPILHTDSVCIKPGKLNFAYFPAVGYTLQTGTTGILAMNISFYTGQCDNTNISGININPQISFNHPQFLLPLNFNIWTNKNKIDLTGDMRYYKYPTYTYGLGGYTQLADANLINYNYARVYLEALKQIAKSKFYVGIGYNLDYHFDIYEEGKGTDFSVYNENLKHTTSSGVNLDLLYDSRKNQNYPENSTYASLCYRYNAELLGSDEDWHSIYLEYKKYINLPNNSHNVLALWSLDWFTFGGKPPYFDLPSTGWDNFSNTGRGYIQSRLRGPSMVYAEAEYRFRFLKSGILGGSIFANGESVSEWGSNRFETILPGVGAGVRIKLNKISGANLAIDYGWGMGGSSGLFFNINEVF